MAPKKHTYKTKNKRKTGAISTPSYTKTNNSNFYGHKKNWSTNNSFLFVQFACVGKNEPEQQKKTKTMTPVILTLSKRGWISYIRMFLDDFTIVYNSFTLYLYRVWDRSFLVHFTRDRRSAGLPRRPDGASRASPRCSSSPEAWGSSRRSSQMAGNRPDSCSVPVSSWLPSVEETTPWNLKNQIL